MIEVSFLVWSYVCVVGLFSFGGCCFLIGSVLSAKKALTECREQMEEKVAAFEEVLAKASKANVSLGEKLLEVSTRIDNLESWRTMVGISDVSKKKWTN